MKNILRNDREFEELKNMLKQDSDVPVRFDESECPQDYPCLVIWREETLEDLDSLTEKIEEIVGAIALSEEDDEPKEEIIDIPVVNFIQFQFISQASIKELLSI